MPMIENSILGLGPHGFHRLVYFEWGDPAGERVLICVHGLTRAAATSMTLPGPWKTATASSALICPGAAAATGCRWPPATSRPPTFRTWRADRAPRRRAGGLARRLPRRADGDDAGGSAEDADPQLVVDDIGGYVGVEALQRIAAYVGQDPAFADRAGLEGLHAGGQRRLRPADRCPVGAHRRPWPPHRREPANGASTTIRSWRSRSRRASPSRSRYGRYGTRSPARC